MAGGAPNETSIPALGRGVRLRENKADGSPKNSSPSATTAEKMFELDQISAEILTRIDGDRTVGAIVDDLADAFNAPRAEILGDVLAFLQDFAVKRVVTL